MPSPTAFPYAADVRIGWLGPGHFNGCAAIDAAAHRRTPRFIAGNSLDLLAYFRLPGTTGFIAYHGSVIFGYLLYQVNVSEARITLSRIVIHPRHQRQRIACRLLSDVLVRATALNYSVNTVVPEWNLPAQCLLRSLAIPCTRILRGHYLACDALQFDLRRKPTIRVAY